MIKSNQTYFNWLNRLLDFPLLVGSYYLSVWIWLSVLRNDLGNAAYYYAFQNPLPMLVVLSFFLFVFQCIGLYDSFRTRSLITELVRLFLANTVSCAVALGVIFLCKVGEFSRGVAVLFFLISYTLLSIKRVVLRLFLHSARAKGFNLKYVLVVGCGELAQKYLARIGEHPEYGFSPVGYVGVKCDDEVGKYLGDYSELSDILDRYNPDEIVIALEQYESAQMRQVVFTCEKQGIRTCIIPFYNDYLPASATIDAMEDVRLINIRSIPLDITFNKVTKRLFDIVFSALVILLCSPIYLIVALGVKLSSPGPILFRQTRVGKERKDFTMYKFRSMRVNDTSDTAWSTKRDSRITPFGAFIRKFSIDELPQFFNVLKGNMSVVGPRPELPFFVQQYRETVPRYMIKHQVKPGITGWAQVHGYRGDTSIEKRIEYDLWYIENWSLFLDIRIIFMTVFGGMMNEEKNLPWDKDDEEVEEKEETPLS